MGVAARSDFTVHKKLKMIFFSKFLASLNCYEWLFEHDIVMGFFTIVTNLGLVCEHYQSKQVVYGQFCGHVS